MPFEFPARAWLKLGAELFSMHGCTYLLVVECCSRFVEIAKLTSARSGDVIVHLKCMFSGHGIPHKPCSRIKSLRVYQKILRVLVKCRCNV